ncbi:hypothetical protein [Oceanomicrobium pacificus]|uniref:Uncharacterized protein n=1 Tax=Oceanomicrobium pacificus TaxID=2692916 RepID=A0A6B0TYR4_9RHOB|nr:hypothetical protein [Oceanomicrobium pacificus]MXU66568.1 hypothetical protein [Oceanomicrobium pacificus]
MIRTTRGLAFCLVIGMTATGGSQPVSAANIARACLASDRSPGAEVCACAQSVANQVLTRSDQNKAVKIIAEPDKFIDYKYSKSANAKAFLERYKVWGEMASKICGT